MWNHMELLNYVLVPSINDQEQKVSVPLDDRNITVGCSAGI